MKPVTTFRCCDAFHPWLGVAMVLCAHFPGTQAMEAQVDEAGVTHYVLLQQKNRSKSPMPAVNSKPRIVPSQAVRPVAVRLGAMPVAHGVRFVSSTEPDLRSMAGAQGGSSAVTSAAPSAHRLAPLSATQGAPVLASAVLGTENAGSFLSAGWPQVGGGLSRGAQARAADYWPLMVKAASQFNLDPLLIRSVIQAESAFNPLALSPKGAMGLMQLMPATARRMGVAEGGGTVAEEWRVASVAALLQQPEVNIQAGSKYLAYLMRLFEGNTVLAVAAYNAGEGAVQRAGQRIPPYPETQAYVRKVLALYAKAKEQAGHVSPELGAAPPELGAAGPT